jgi:hypothetical protein
MKFVDRLDEVAKRFERLFSGNTPSDPLYMTNRTVGQKVRMGLLIGTPVLAIGVFMALALNNYFDPAPSPEKLEAAAAGKQPTGEIAAKVLPNMDKGFTTDYSREVEIVEAFVGSGSDHTLSGKLRNNTDHVVRVADVVFDVTDEDGSQLGGVAVRVENIAARSTANFKVGLEQRGARTALVREVHSR